MTLHGETVPVTVESVDNHRLEVRSAADLVPGAQLRMAVWQRRGAAPFTLRIQVTARGEEDGDGQHCYELRILAQKLPRWLMKCLNGRSAYRTQIIEHVHVPVALVTERSRWRGQLLDASPEGLGIHCSASLSMLSRIGSEATIELELPSGTCCFPVRLCRLQPLGEGTLVGLERINDGELSTRQAHQQLVDYIMQRQREELQQRRGAVT